ncbi:MAG TPA: hypothetical protein VEF92_03890 [Burkholderiales bacterium]|nr:hypothetical protein [Burkholderiales bacterium]
MNKPERLSEAVAAKEFMVGGVRMRRPFRIRRLGHFGVNVTDGTVGVTRQSDLPLVRRSRFGPSSRSPMVE